METRISADGEEKKNHNSFNLGLHFVKYREKMFFRSEEMKQ